MHIFPGSLAYTHLFNVREPVSPVWLAEVVVLDVLHDLGEVVLRRVPAANPVIRSKITLNLKPVSRRGIPLQRTKKKNREKKSIKTNKINVSHIEFNLPLIRASQTTSQLHKNA